MTVADFLKLDVGDKFVLRQGHHQRIREVTCIVRQKLIEGGYFLVHYDVQLSHDFHQSAAIRGMTSNATIQELPPVQPWHDSDG